MTWTAEKIEGLLRTKKDDALYDEWNGIHGEALQAIGFYPNYITYHSGAKAAAGSPPTWVSASKAFADNVTKRRAKDHDVSRVLHWTWMRGLPHARHNVTHARGVFVIRSLRLVITYEPRILYRKDLQNARRRKFNKAHSEFCNYAGKTYRVLTVFGNQVSSHDCEKRVLRFGMCCLPTVAKMVKDGDYSAPMSFKCDAPNCWLRVTGILPFSKRTV